MRHLLVAALFVAPLTANSKPMGATVSAASVAGSELAAYAPSTATLTIEMIAARFAETDLKINTLTARFRQFVRMDGSDVTQTVEGDVVFKKPDLLRLTHRVPEAQTVVSDGTWLWVHRSATNQVIQSRLDAWRKSEPLAQGLLDFGKSADLLTRYAVDITSVSAPGADGHRAFTLTLRPKAPLKNDDASNFVLILKATTRDFFPADATLRVGRASIRSLFENVRLNAEMPQSTFQFTPPANADLFKTPEPK
jgi:outer membrane lipoprotein carrier protein